MTFQDTLVAAKTGDSRAEQELFERWRALLTCQAAKSLGKACAARIDPSDVVQDSLVQASRDISQFRGQSEAEWVRWLQTIVFGQANKNREKQHAQKRDVRREIEPTVQLADRQHSPEDALLRLEEAAATAAALEKLPPEMKSAICGRVFAQQSWKEIAEQLGKTEQAARVLWTRGIRQLKQILETKNAEQETR